MRVLTSHAIRMTSPFLILGLALSSCAQPSTSTPVDSSPPLGNAQAVVVDWDNTSDMNFAEGYSTMFGSLAGTCVKGTVASQTIGNNGANYNIQIISSTQELAKSLGVTAEATLGFGLFEASAKSKYLQSEDSNSRSVYVLVSSDIVGPTLTLTNAHLMNSTEDPQGDDNATAFTQDYLDFYGKCGDKFLAAATTGATYRGVMRINSTSTAEKTELSVELKAKYGSASGSAAVSQAISQIGSQYAININEFSDGVLPSKSATDYQSLIDNANLFPQLFAQQCVGKSVSEVQAGCLKQASFKDYQTLTLKQANTSVINQAQAQTALLTTYATGYQTSLNDANSAKNNPYLYTDTVAQINNAADVAAQGLNNAKTALSLCNQDIRNCQDPQTLKPPLADPSTLPALQLHPIDLGKPVNCLDYKNKYRALGDAQRGFPLVDAQYRLYIGGQTLRAVNIWCADMDTDSPKEYLTLPESNYSRCDCYGPGRMLETLWKRIKINPATMEIDKRDTRYGLATKGAGYPVYGEVGSVLYQTNQPVTEANGDLHGTNLQFPADMYVQIQPDQYATSNGSATRIDTQQITLVSPNSGYATFTSNDAPLKLEFLDK